MPLLLSLCVCVCVCRICPGTINIIGARPFPSSPSPTHSSLPFSSSLRSPAGEDTHTHAHTHMASWLKDGSANRPRSTLLGHVNVRACTCLQKAAAGWDFHHPYLSCLLRSSWVDPLPLLFSIPLSRSLTPLLSRTAVSKRTHIDTRNSTISSQGTKRRAGPVEKQPAQQKKPFCMILSISVCLLVVACVSVLSAQ